jgi:hypothetical protein
MLRNGGNENEITRSHFEEIGMELFMYESNIAHDARSPSTSYGEIFIPYQKKHQHAITNLGINKWRRL